MASLPWRAAREQDCCLLITCFNLRNVASEDRPYIEHLDTLIDLRYAFDIRHPTFKDSKLVTITTVAGTYRFETTSIRAFDCTTALFVYMVRVAEYRFGWICAVTVEYVIAREMLDEKYPPPQDLPEIDTNPYCFGRVGEHNVVIACLPAAKYGTTSATGVATRMHVHFPNIHGYLMVGIAGGAPMGKEDIRLGDLVISMPDNDLRESGVVRYDHGKTIQRREFQRTGSLNSPPIALLSAVQDLKAIHESQGNRIEEIIEATLSRNPRLRKKYTKPSSDMDVLYHHDFVHFNEKQPCEEICVQHHHQIIRRKKRDDAGGTGVVHYGLIASSDKLMKDAVIRDSLGQKLGILCFETEAAGLMDWIPCLVIRGICDYSDTHKNDIWQGFAAACAAAYAKELLGVIRGRRSPSTSLPGRYVLISAVDTAEDVANSKPRTRTVDSEQNLGSKKFDQLTAGTNYVADNYNKEESMWRKLTLVSWSTYERIYQDMTKDRKGRVTVEAFRVQIPEGPLRQLVQQYWSLFEPWTIRNPLPRSYAMALLYMLHIHKATNYHWTREDMPAERLFVLRRFAEWTPCKCNQACGLSWNYATDRGLHRATSDHADENRCLALKYKRAVDSGRLDYWIIERCKPYDYANKQEWKKLGGRSRGQRETFSSLGDTQRSMSRSAT